MDEPNPLKMLREMPGWLVGAWRSYFRVRGWEQQEAAQSSGSQNAGKTVRHRARKAG